MTPKLIASLDPEILFKKLIIDWSGGVSCQQCLVVPYKQHLVVQYKQRLVVHYKRLVVSCKQWLVIS